MASFKVLFCEWALQVFLAVFAILYISSYLTVCYFEWSTLQGHQEFPTETIEFPLPKKQTKFPIEVQTLKQERETNDDHATMREGFSLVQNIFFCCIHWHSSCPLVGIWLKSCRKLCNLVWSFDNRLLRELRVSLKGCMSTMVWYMNHSQA